MGVLEEERRELVEVVTSGGSLAAKLAEASIEGIDHLIAFFKHAKSYDKDDLKAMGLVNRTATDVLARQIRVDEALFRARSDDKLGEILEKIAAARLAKPAK